MFAIKKYVSKIYVNAEIEKFNSATVEDVKHLLSSERQKNNLIAENADKISYIVQCFESTDEADLFTWYMEMLVTACKKISNHKEWEISRIHNKGIPTKELDNHHKKVCKSISDNVEGFTRKILTRADFREPLKSYEYFEKAIREYINIAENVGE